MADELDGRKKPTTDQRRAMAKLAEEIFAGRIQEARDDEGALTQEITGELRQELGVDALDHKIDTLEDQVRLLEKKKETLGWKYGGFIETSKSGRLLKGRVAKRSSSVRDLEKQRKDVLAGIWTCETVEELNEMVDGL
jgi:hypothetical protein